MDSERNDYAKIWVELAKFFGNISCLHVRIVSYVSRSCIVYCTNP